MTINVCDTWWGFINLCKDSPRDRVDREVRHRTVSLVCQTSGLWRTWQFSRIRPHWRKGWKMQHRPCRPHLNQKQIASFVRNMYSAPFAGGLTGFQIWMSLRTCSCISGRFFFNLEVLIIFGKFLKRTTYNRTCIALGAIFSQTNNVYNITIVCAHSFTILFNK